ncbi:MAG: diguanylate cyclase domain-containing protein [Sulfuricaulis sp.]
MLSDVTGTSAVMHLLGQAGLVFLFCPLWVIIGYGLRYGRSYLFTAMILGIGGFVITAVSTPFWHIDPYLLIGYVGALVILPLFFSSLLKKLHTTNAELADLAGKLRKLATHDALTGLPNRTLFTESLEHELSLAQRHREKLAVLFIDLDSFKEINDTHGHQSGDIVLKTVASRLLKHIRKSDIVARLAGDEFVVLLTDVDRDTAKHVTHKLVHDIRTSILVANCSVMVTASVGIAIFPDSGSTANEIMAKADTAMYRCKQQGKNRMMSDGDAESVPVDISRPFGSTAKQNDKPAEIVAIRPPRP